MKAKTVELYIGVVHQKDDEDDFVDIKFISLSKEQANIELLEVKEYAIKVLRLKCVVSRTDYVLFKSSNERSMLEAFYVERLIIVKGDSSKWLIKKQELKQ